MKKNRKRQYETVSHLDLENAKSVSEFAADHNNGKGCNRVYIYKLHDAGKVKIVDFHGYNFVLPVEKVS